MDEDRMRRPSPLSPGTTPTAPDDTAGALHALASMAAERHHIPAMAYGVIVDGRLVTREASATRATAPGRRTSARSSASRP